MTTIEKRYTDYPFAHRQHKHEGHCAKIHGHSWAFAIVFTAEELDECGFVTDFGKLQWLKEFLTDNFDHTLVLNEDDPELGYFKEFLAKPKLAKIVVVPNCGAEGLAKYVYERGNAMLPEDLLKRGVRISSVTVFEDSKNSATYKGV